MRLIETAEPDNIFTLDIRTVYSWYEKTFREIDTLAAQRHLMTYDEFYNVWNNHAVKKFFAFNDEGEVVGMSVMTNKLREWPIVSWRFFEKQFPDEYKRNACWYVGFTGASEAHVFSALVNAMLPYPRGTQGIVAMDYCTHNMDQRNLHGVAYLILQRTVPDTQMARLDSQTTVAYRFDGKGFPTA
jgi:hypothetical protein